MTETRCWLCRVFLLVIYAAVFSAPWLSRYVLPPTAISVEYLEEQQWHEHFLRDLRGLAKELNTVRVDLVVRRGETP